MRRCRSVFMLAAIMALAIALHPPVFGDEAPDSRTGESHGSVKMLSKRFRVTNPQGDPVVGATVIPWAVRSEQGHGNWMINGSYEAEPPTIVTDATGRGEFAFPRFLDMDGQVPPLEYTCKVVHPDYAGSTYNDIPVAEDEYKEESVIQVRQGATIEITPFAEGQNLALEDVYVMWSGDAPRKYKNKINDRGAIELPRLPAGNELLMAVYAPDEGPVLFSSAQKVELADGGHHQLRMELKPGVRVEGRLTGPVERPVNDGRAIGQVILSHNRVEGNLVWRVAAKMRIDGSFVFEAMPRGALQVIAVCDGAVAESGEGTPFLRNQQRQPGANFSRPQMFALWEVTTRVAVKMVPTASCRVRVIDGDGATIKGAKCSFSPIVGWWHDGSQIYGRPFFSTVELFKNPSVVDKPNPADQLFTGTTDERGEALITNLPGESCLMDVQYDRHRFPGPQGKQSVILNSGQESELTVRMNLGK